MKQAFVNLVSDQLQNNCLLTPAFCENTMIYRCCNPDCGFWVEYADGKFVVQQKHDCLQQTYPQTSALMQENQQIILSFSFDEIFQIVLKKQEKFTCRYGTYQHDSLIGQPLGSKIYNNNESGFTIALPFTPTLHTESMKRRTQILFTPDISIILMKTSIKPGWNVTEAGIGSGSLSHAFLQAIYPGGSLHNYDIVQERVDEAQREFNLYSSRAATSSLINVLEQGFPNVADRTQNLVFLDLPQPERCLKEVERVLLNFGHFVVFLPCVEQVHQLLGCLYKHTFHNVEVIKMHYFTHEFDIRVLGAQQIAKAQQVEDVRKMKHFMKGTVARTHTGYLVFCRKGATQ